MGNRELLAVKLALEEWRHWLEGSKHPLIVWTDHKNLSYLQQAKRLNPRQASWALFFTHFNFVISYRPGSKNVKADALSRQYDCTQRNRSPELIIHKDRILAPIRRSIENCVREELHGAYIPDKVPTGCLFVPKETRSEVLQWGHTSPLAGHSRMERTLDFVQRRFWWPEMFALLCRPAQFALSRSLLISILPVSYTPCQSTVSLVSYIHGFYHWRARIWR